MDEQKLTDWFPPEVLPARPEAGSPNLRDYFAAKALEWSGSSEWFSKDPQHVAARAYRLADAMLKERAK